MAKASDDWVVRPHGKIVTLAENLKWVQGSLPGMSLKRCMTVVRLSDGRLVIHNGIALDEAGRAELEAWGTPACLSVPNAGHRLDAPAYKKRYPNLHVFAPRGAAAKVAERVRGDGTYGEFPKDDTVHFAPVDGLDDREGAMFVRSSDGVTLVLNDCVFNMDRKRDPLGFIFTTLLGSAPGPRVSRLAKFVFVDDKAAFRASLERLAATPHLTRLVVAHEKIAHGPDAATALILAATYV